MISLIIATPDSGKSKLAEDLALEQAAGGRHYYIATMLPFGEEGQKRIEKHRAMRKGKGFITLEWPDKLDERLEEIEDWAESTVLLECMSNLIGNELYSEQNVGLSDAFLTERIVESVRLLGEKAANLIIVSNVFPTEDEGYDEETVRYVKLVAMVNDRLKALADLEFSRLNGEWIRYEYH